MAAQLFARSHFSLLNGLMSIDELLHQAKNHGFTSIALTDYHVMYGALDFFIKAKKMGIKPIFGLEVSVNDYTLVLLAKNNTGMKVLHHLSYKLSQSDTIDLSDFSDEQEDLIVILPSENGPFEGALYQEDMTSLHETFKKFTSQFKTFYIGMTHQESKFFNRSNKLLEKLSHDYNVKTIAMPKVYYKNQDDHHAFRALRAIDTQKIMNDPSLTFAPDRHFQSYDALKNLYSQKCLDEAQNIADMCDVDLFELKTTLPEFENHHGLENPEFLTQLSKLGLKKRLNDNVTENYAKRLQYELDVINKMGFTNYFLIVYDVIRFAKIKGINVGPGRGSAAGSLVSYSLGITEVDPIAYNLLFERFLNPMRASMPDIDIDFPDDRRDEVVSYAMSKYGHDRVAHIVAFGNLRARQSFRDCGRILNVPVYKINQASKLITTSMLMDAYNQNKRFSALIDTNPELKEVFKLALKLEGTPRHISQHAAGIVASEKKLLDVVPMVALDDQMNVTQYDMTHLESLGLIKIDFLGIRNLSIIDRIARQIKTSQKDFSIQSIPLDDEKTFDLISKGETIGIFQLESDGMKNLLKKLKPKRFLDIVDTIALYRPGPMENIPTYLSNRENPKTITYLHDDLKSITEDTYGILVYQEQIMEVAQKFAGFSLAKADILRKAMSAKDARALKALEQEFLDGAKALNYDAKLSQSIFDLIYKFANYGFNKSHSVAYALVAYQLAYLKANYAERFYAELLNSVIGDDSKTKKYIDECQRLQVKLEVPSLNTSDVFYTLHSDLIRLPLSIIKGISRNSAERIVLERDEHGDYKSYVDAVVRLKHQKLNEKQINALIDAGTLDIFGLNRETMKENLQEVLLYASLITIKDKNDHTIFNYGLVSEPSLNHVSANKKKTLNLEFEVLGFYLSDYPTKALKAHYETDAIYQLVPRTYPYRVIVKVDRIKEHLAKNGKLMAFLQVSDDTGSMDAVMFNNVYERFKDQLHVDDIALIKGNVKEEGSILVSDFHIFET